MSNYTLVTNKEELTQACDVFKNHEWIGFDVETTALDPFDGQIRLVQISDGDTTFVIDLFRVKDLKPLKALLTAPRPRIIAHNAKFDVKWVLHQFDAEIDGVFCTMLADQLIAAGDTDHKHSLLAVADRYLGIQLDKSEQLSDWGAERLDPSQVEYAAKDASILVPLKDKLVERLHEMQLWRVAELENQCIVPVARMELNGFFLDKQAWMAQLTQIQSQRALADQDLQHTLGRYYPSPSISGIYNINLGSPVQVTDALRWAGVPVKDSTEEWRLQPLAKDYPVIDMLFHYRGLAKAEDSYGESWLEFIRPETGRIHAEFNQMRANTGRFSCSKPNLQQIPAESSYRWCFKSEPGKILVIADYSQIELRILAHRCEDPLFIQAFLSGADFHTATAAQVFNCKLQDVTPEQRSFAKRLNFGLVYGISARKFAMLTGTTQVEAEEVMQKYFSTYKVLDQYIREEGRMAVVNRECRTESGRLLKLRFDETSSGSVGGAKRNGVNMPIQGTSADILKRALRLLHDSLGDTTGKLVNIVHDEVLVECEDAEAMEVSERLEDAMVQAGEEFVTRVPILVDPHVSKEWKK